MKVLRKLVFRGILIVSCSAGFTVGAYADPYDRPCIPVLESEWSALPADIFNQIKDSDARSLMIGSIGYCANQLYKKSDPFYQIYFVPKSHMGETERNYRARCFLLKNNFCEIFCIDWLIVLRQKF